MGGAARANNTAKAAKKGHLKPKVKPRRMSLSALLVPHMADKLPAGDGEALIAKLIQVWRARGEAQRTPFYSTSARGESWTWDACADELEAALRSSSSAIQQEDKKKDLTPRA